MTDGPDAPRSADQPSPPSSPEPAPEGRRARRENARRTVVRRRASVVGILGELLLTGGVLVLLFLGWQIWLSEIIVGREMLSESTQQSQEWNDQAAREPIVTPEPEPEPTAEPTEAPEEPLPEIALNPPVAAVPADGSKFGMLIVPRWGADYYRTVAEGVDPAGVLDRGRLGRYPGTQMPGEVGNFALAAHRMGKGGSLRQIDDLQLGDNIYVETAAGWYQYSFRNLEYVRPSGVGVLNAIPQSDAAMQGERFITLTSCNPEHTTAERIIAYGMFDRFHPRDPSAPNFGAPEEIAATVNGA